MSQKFSSIEVAQGTPTLETTNAISVIIPTYNEAVNIGALLERLDETMQSAQMRYEVLVIDDHSQDATVQIAEELANTRQLPIRVLSKHGQPGKSFSLLEGFAAAKYDVLAMIDGDLQYPPEALVGMEKALATSDLVIADRRSSYAKADFKRGLLSRVFGFLIVLLFGIRTDMQSGLKLFRRGVYEAVTITPKRWNFDLYLVVQAVAQGFSYANVPIEYHERAGGRSKVAVIGVTVELLITAFKLKVKIVRQKLARQKWVKGLGRVIKFLMADKGELVALPAPEDIEEQVKRYQRWLDTDIECNRQINTPESARRYIEEADRIVKIGPKQIRSFAPFRPALSALQTFTKTQKVTFLILGIVGLVGLAVWRLHLVAFLIALMTALYLIDLALTFLVSARTLLRSDEVTIDDRVVAGLAAANWPTYTILCPLYKEAAIVPQFVAAMQSLDYPTDKLQIMFLTEAVDGETREAILALDLPPHFEVISVPNGEPRTKPRACNYGLLKAKGDYVVIFDAEDMPDPLQLKKAVLTFARFGPELGCVQAKLNFYNPTQNILTRWFTAEYSTWYGLTLPGLQLARLSLPLGGTSNHFRTAVLRLLGAWDAFNVTEDCDLGLRLSRFGMKTVVLDSTTYEEANSQFKNWLRQRSRWIKGYMQTYLVYMRRPQRFLQPSQWREFISLQLVIGGKAAVLLVNPVMWVLTLVYFVLRFWVGPIYQQLFPMAVLYAGTVCFIAGNFLFIYLSLVGCLKRNQPGLVKWTLTIPLYWVMMSISAYIALYQLITKPHYWEKTNHGLHLKNKPQLPKPATPAALQEVPAERVMQFSATVPAVEMSLEAYPSKPAQHEMTVNALSSHEIHTQEAVAVLDRPAELSAERPVEPAMALTVAEESETSLAEMPERFDEVETTSREITDEVADHQPAVVEISTEQAAQGTATIELNDYFGAYDPLKPLTVRPPKPEKRPRDKWLVLSLLTALVCGGFGVVYFFEQHQLLLYGDSYSHMQIARRVFDSYTPGLAQLGAVWLPLPHLLMMPFIWNNFLWGSGLAGSLVALPCYFIATLYIYLAARRLTHHSAASFVGTLVFVVNPNIIYLSTTALTELVLIAPMVAAGYYLLAWVQTQRQGYLLLATLAIFLSTLCRYDAWFVFVGFVGIVTLVEIVQGQGWKKIEDTLLIFGSLGGLGIALWLIWNLLIFGDALYFQHGPYSAQAQQKVLIESHTLYTYHDLYQSVRYFGVDIVIFLGPLPVILAGLGLVWLLFRRRLSLPSLAALLYLIPVAFYVLSLYTGQAVLRIPGLDPKDSPEAAKIFNVRYGAMAVPPVALFVAYAALGWAGLWQDGRAGLKRWYKRGLRYGGLALLSGIILVQAYITATGGIITLQEGMSLRDSNGCTLGDSITYYLAQHYDGGIIVNNIYGTGLYQLEPKAGIAFKNVIYEGSGPVWDKALKDPTALADWLIVNPTSPDDLLGGKVDYNSTDFQANFSLMTSESNGLRLYKRNGVAIAEGRTVDRAVFGNCRLPEFP